MAGRPRWHSPREVRLVPVPRIPPEIRLPPFLGNPSNVWGANERARWIIQSRACHPLADPPKTYHHRSPLLVILVCLFNDSEKKPFFEEERRVRERKKGSPLIKEEHRS